MSISIGVDNKRYPGHRQRFRKSIDLVLSTRIHSGMTTDVRTQCMKSKGVRVLGSGNFATVIQYPYRADKVIRVSSTERVNGELDIYEDYVRYLRRSRSNNPCLPDIHGAITESGLLFVLMDKFRTLSKPEQDLAKGVFYGDIKPENQAQQNLRDAFKLFKRSTLKADDVKGDNIMAHWSEYKIVDPLGGLGIAEPERPDITESPSIPGSYIEDLYVDVLVHSHLLVFSGVSIGDDVYDDITRCTTVLRQDTIQGPPWIYSFMHQWLYSSGMETNSNIENEVSFMFSRDSGRVTVLACPVQRLKSEILAIHQRRARAPQRVVVDGAW